METMIFLLLLAAFVTGFAAWRAHDRIDLQRSRTDDVYNELRLICRQLNDAIPFKEAEPASDDTHLIRNNGTKFRVRKVRPGYGVDHVGKEWPLFIKPGQSNYSIQKL